MSERRIKGKELSVVSSVSASITLRQRSNFAVQHLLAAARFSRKVGQIERENMGAPLGSFFDEIISYVSATVLSSVAALEANINEYFADPEANFPQHNLRLFNKTWELIEQKPILDKYQWALVLKGVAELNKGELVFQDADNVIRLRNLLVHFKPEWHDEQIEHKKIESRLTGKFKLSPFIGPTGVFFPQKCMSYGCASWAVTSTLGFMDYFSNVAGLPNKFDQHRDSLEVS